MVCQLKSWNKISSSRQRSNYDMEWGRVTYTFCAMFLWATCIVLLVFQSFASRVCLASCARESKIRNTMSILSPIKVIRPSLFSSFEIQKLDAHDMLIISKLSRLIYARQKKMSSLRSSYVTLVVEGYHTRKQCITVQLKDGNRKEKKIGTEGLIRGSRSCRIGRAWRSWSPYPSWVDASGKEDDFSTFPPTSKQNYLTCHCAQSRISDIVEFTINIADLVSNLPGRAEERDNFTVGVLKLQEQVRNEV
jgi:hypothetical protein